MPGFIRGQDLAAGALEVGRQRPTRDLGDTGHDELAARAAQRRSGGAAMVWSRRAGLRGATGRNAVVLFWGCSDRCAAYRGTKQSLIEAKGDALLRAGVA